VPIQVIPGTVLLAISGLHINPIGAEDARTRHDSLSPFLDRWNPRLLALFYNPSDLAMATRAYSKDSTLAIFL